MTVHTSTINTNEITNSYIMQTLMQLMKSSRLLLLKTCLFF